MNVTAWWQVVLVILGSIAAGLAVGGVLYYAITQVRARAKVAQRAEAWTPAPAPTPVDPPAAVAKPSPAPSVKPDPMTVVKPSPAPVAYSSPVSAAKPSPAPVVKPDPVPAAKPNPASAVKPNPVPAAKPTESHPVESSPADLVAEIDANRRVAGGTWNGKLQQFQTRAWDNRGDEVHGLPPDLRDQIAEAYSDMSLANSIVWLATEMGRRSESLDDSYLKLRGSISGRLDQIYNRLGATRRPVSPA